MFIKGGLKRLSSPTCRVPALDSARANRPLNRLSPAKRTDTDARVTSQPCFPERDAGAVALASRAQATPHREGGKVNKSPGRRTVERVRLSDRTAQVCRARYRNSSSSCFLLHPKMEQHGGPFWEALWPCLKAVDTYDSV